MKIPIDQKKKKRERKIRIFKIINNFTIRHLGTTKLIIKTHVIFE